MIARTLLVLRIVAVLSVALVAGHVVQLIRPMTAAEAASGPQSAPENSVLIPELAGITAVSAAGSAANPDCALRLVLDPAPGAMIDLTLSAPCNLGERVVIRHAGLAFAETIGVTGLLQTQLPAMATEATVAAYVGSADIVLGKIAVAEVADFLRVAVQMPGAVRFDLRAEEGGRVFVARTAMPERAAPRVFALGQARIDDPMLSQVYSVPLRDLADPALTVELRITPETCGRSLVAEVVLSRLGKVIQTNPSVAVPLCGSSGDILLLKNLLPDLTLATLE